jgi:hypothetical protein
LVLVEVEVPSAAVFEWANDGVATTSDSTVAAPAAITAPRLMVLFMVFPLLGFQEQNRR